MGQYWIVVNLDKREFIHPHLLGCGMKLKEQLGSGHGTPDALLILCANMVAHRGGGDLDLDTNFYGPERTEASEHNLGAPVVDAYNVIAKRTIGRWAGDRIAAIGDYAEDADLPNSPFPVSKACDMADRGELADITADVAAVIEHECCGTFTGEGWRDFIRRGEEAPA